MDNPLATNRLLSLFAAPMIWAGHFLLCYVLVSLACIYRFDSARVGAALITLAALGAVAMIAWSNARKLAAARGRDAHDAGLDRFFAKTSLLLCALSSVALAWVAFPAALLPTCAA